MSEGAEPSLLGQKLLVRHRVDGVREGEGRAAKETSHTCWYCKVGANEEGRKEEKRK